MMHEFHQIIKQIIVNQTNSLKSVLVTLVDLDGSSYRKPGVRMLFSETGQQTGAISGGCVEKEVWNHAQAVFENNEAKVITYNGKYRLGCDGFLFILIEPVYLSEQFIKKFYESLKERKSFIITSFYNKKNETSDSFGSLIHFHNEISFSFSTFFNHQNHLPALKQIIKPYFRLIILGAEHDATKLCEMASILGWEVEIVCSLKSPKSLEDFPNAKKVYSASPDSISLENIDSETAVVLMTHNYALDFSYLVKLFSYKPIYIGVLGSTKRSEQLKNELFEYITNVSEDFLENIHSPAGIAIGAETPEEIALSILSEIVAITKLKKNSLTAVTGKKTL